MQFQVDILLRGEENATTKTIEAVRREPPLWTDDDVETVLKEMLRAVDRAKNPEGAERVVFLRGISWIVEAYEGGGVVIALEIPTGAAIAGPFDIAQPELEAMITRVLAARPSSATGGHAVH